MPLTPDTKKLSIDLLCRAADYVEQQNLECEKQKNCAFFSDNEKIAIKGKFITSLQDIYKILQNNKSLPCSDYLSLAAYNLINTKYGSDEKETYEQIQKQKIGDFNVSEKQKKLGFFLFPSCISNKTDYFIKNFMSKHLPVYKFGIKYQPQTHGVAVLPNVFALDFSDKKLPHINKLYDPNFFDIKVIIFSSYDKSNGFTDVNGNFCHHSVFITFEKIDLEQHNNQILLFIPEFLDRNLCVKDKVMKNIHIAFIERSQVKSNKSYGPTVIDFTLNQNNDYIKERNRPGETKPLRSIEPFEDVETYGKDIFEKLNNYVYSKINRALSTSFNKINQTFKEILLQNNNNI